MPLLTLPPDCLVVTMAAMYGFSPQVRPCLQWNDQAASQPSTCCQHNHKAALQEAACNKEILMSHSMVACLTFAEAPDGLTWLCTCMYTLCCDLQSLHHDVLFACCAQCAEVGTSYFVRLAARDASLLGMAASHPDFAGLVALVVADAEPLLWPLAGGAHPFWIMPLGPYLSGNDAHSLHAWSEL